MLQKENWCHSSVSHLSVVSLGPRGTAGQKVSSINTAITSIHHQRSILLIQSGVPKTQRKGQSPKISLITWDILTSAACSDESVSMRANQWFTMCDTDMSLDAFNLNHQPKIKTQSSPQCRWSHKVVCHINLCAAWEQRGVWCPLTKNLTTQAEIHHSEGALEHFKLTIIVKSSALISCYIIFPNPFGISGFLGTSGYYIS